MTGRTLRLLILLGMVSAAMLTGCAADQKKIADLSKQVSDLTDIADQRQMDVARLSEREAQLMADVQSRDDLLDVKDVEIVDLKLAVANATSGGTNGSGGKWEPVAGGEKVTLASDVLFAPGKATLTAKGKAAVDTVVGNIKQDYAGKFVMVQGFCDNDPIRKSRWKDNLELSSQRAMAVARHLISRGIAKDRVAAVGRGATAFVASNSTPTDKGKNRRVEIVVVK